MSSKKSFPVWSIMKKYYLSNARFSFNQILSFVLIGTSSHFFATCLEILAKWLVWHSKMVWPVGLLLTSQTRTENVSDLLVRLSFYFLTFNAWPRNGIVSSVSSTWENSNQLWLSLDFIKWNLAKLDTLLSHVIAQKVKFSIDFIFLCSVWHYKKALQVSWWATRHR